MAPVVTVPRPITADLARAVIGPDDPAVTRRVIVIRRCIVEPPMKEMPVKVVPVMREAVATVENMSGTKTAAADHCTAASKSASGSLIPAAISSARTSGSEARPRMSGSSLPFLSPPGSVACCAKKI